MAVGVRREPRPGIDDDVIDKKMEGEEEGRRREEVESAEGMRVSKRMESQQKEGE